MANHYGEHLKLTIFGTSHGPGIGMTLAGIPAGLPVDLDALQAFLNRRAPGRSPWATGRKEADIPQFLSGLTDGCTNGDTIQAEIQNQNVRSRDYEALKHIPRPGHADFTAWAKYGPDFDMAGGGPFSGRMTAPLCIAGGLCKQWLAAGGIQIGAHISEIYHIKDTAFDPIQPELGDVDAEFPVLHKQRVEAMKQAIREAKDRGDSLGGIIECAVTGLPAGLGGPLFGGVEGKLSQILYAIPAVKGVEFGLGFENARHPGSFTNDPFAVVDGRVRTLTNHCGGILGGITNGMPLLLRVAIKPTPSISLPQQSVDLDSMEEVTVAVTGRHDPCILPRAVPVVEAAVAVAIMDLLLTDADDFGAKL